MAYIRLYFLFGVSPFLLGCCFLTSANTTNPAVTSSVTPTTISPSSALQSANFSTSPQTCRTRSICINATVSATGNNSSVAVQSSCSVTFVGCVADSSNSTTPLTTSSVANTTATTSTLESTPTSPQLSLSIQIDSSTQATDSLSTSTPSTSSTDVLTTPSSSSTAVAATTTATATAAVPTATTTASGSSQTTSLAPSPSISSASFITKPATSSQTSSSDNSTASGNQSSTASPSSSPSTSPSASLPSSSTSPPPSASPSSSSFTSTQSVSQNQTSTVVSSTSAVVQPPTSTSKTKFVTIKVTFDIPFREEYRDRESEAYKELKNNFTEILTITFREMDGFLRVVIISLRKGSVVCDFDVIFNETANPKEEDIKKTIQDASKNGKLGGYAVTKIEVEGEKKDESKEDDLPLWAFVTLILLGALGVVLLTTVIILAVLLKRTKESGPAYRVTGEEWAHYETMSMGDYKVRAEEVERGRLGNRNRNNQPIYENHPTSHSNLTYQVPANGE